MTQPKKVLQPRKCPHCNGTGKQKVEWINSPYGPVPVEKKCPFCEDGFTYEEVIVP